MKRAAAIAMTFVVLGLASGAWAEDTKPLETIPVPQNEPEPPPPAAAPEEEALETVVVTAQRRSENAQAVPVSITVLKPEDISNANIVNSADLAIYTPSLTTNQRFGAETATFAIRGFTQDLRTTASVATYFAEVVAPRGQSSQTSGDGAGPGALFDLENVQVLKGPQGTLFGRNTTGGAILIVPRKPQRTFGGYVEATGGDYSSRRIQGVINVPVTDWFRLRAGVDHNQREGYLRNVTNIGADRLADVGFTSFRLSSILNLGENVENYTIVTYTDSETNGFTRQLFDCNTTIGPTNPFYAFTSEPCQRQLAQQAASGQNGFYDVVSTVPEALSVIKEKRLINTLTWQLGEELHLKNILAYAHLHTENGSDVYGSQFDSLADPDPAREFKIGVSIPNSVPVTSQASYVAELQLQGRSFDRRLQWQTGYYHEQSRPDGFSGNISPVLVSCELSSLTGDPANFNCFDGTAGQLGGVLDQFYKQKFVNQAVYAEAGFDFIDAFGMTLGLRYTWDESSGYGLKQRYTFAGPVPLPRIDTVSEPAVRSEAPTGQLQFAYRPLDDVMAYAKYVRGYRQGSIVLAASPGIDTYGPEKVDTYEIGAKTSFDGFIPGRFNVAVFYNDFTDQQLQTGYISSTDGATTSIFNAGKSRIQGAEVESYFRLYKGLSLAVSYAFLDTKLLEMENRQADVEAAGGVVAGRTYSPIATAGEELPFAPDHTVVTTLAYALPLLETWGLLDLGATFVYTGRQRAAADRSTPYAMLDAYQLLNLNVNWSDVFGIPVDVALFATNALGEKYITSVSGSLLSTGVEARGIGTPRMIGARLRYRFGSR
jgi:iron complex outermembrane receptor protein